MTEAVLTQQFFNALSLGVMYALIAVGFTLFFGVIEVVNFAHGEVFMLGAFAAMLASGVLISCGFSQGSMLFILLILVVVVLIGALFGAVLEKYIVSPMRNAPDIMTLLITLGASIVVREAVMLFVPDGRNPQTFPVLVEMDTIHIGGALVKPEALLCILLSSIMIIGMHRFIQNTTFGRYIRATAQDRGAAMMMGIDVKKVFIFTLIIGSVLGSVAGLMNGMTYNIIKFNMGFAASVKGFAAAVVGGLGNIYGAIIGGLLLGFMEIFTVSFITDGSSYQDMISFIIVILCLVFRPAGLFGEKAYEKV